ncbi:MAG: xanthine dehydrogenase [Candidatus Rokuibacteriota bacterium]|nr:MAG: xanthine dehydrogenase [Candidatus Rokubacteria bacterium]
MSEDLLALASDLQRRGEPFVLATVVRCERPTSAKPGAKALIRDDGTVSGWVGGACAEPTVVREAMNAIRDGRPRLLGLVGEGGRGPSRTEGIVDYPMTCHSGGTLEIYVEPYLPKPLLVLVGHGPVIDALSTLGRGADYAVVVTTGGPAELEQLRLTPRASVVVATHADTDEDVLTHVLTTDAGYVSLVASRRRAAVIVDRLKERGVASDRLGQLKAPAGIDIGATEPAEIAVSILAEIIQHHRSGKPEPATADSMEATDPICGMVVDVASARYRSHVGDRTVYFCCRACKETFDRR